MSDRCWCCGVIGIEHDPYFEVVAMSADAARNFAMPNAWKVEYVGQASDRYAFGARVYRLFASPAAWVRYCTEREQGER